MNVNHKNFCCPAGGRIVKRSWRAPSLQTTLLILAILLIGMVAHAGGQATGLKSRAEEEAEAKVSLSAERIIALLNQEPGLLLQVKRMLVRKAYEQGRILDSSDLTDDALFRLLHEDDGIRILATREIEARNYIRARPTREELASETKATGISNRARTELAASSHDGDNYQPETQEDAYWSTHDPADGSIRTEQPRNWPSPPSELPQNSAPQNPSRQLRTTSAPGDQDFYDGLDADFGIQRRTDSATHISAEQLPGLLKASAASRDQGNDPAALASLRIPASISSNLGGAIGGGRTSDTIARSTRTVTSLPELDHPVIGSRPVPYSDVPSLTELYSQVSQRPAVIEHFGASIFRNGTGNLERLPMDLPAGPEYVLGPGDGLSIELWGAVSQRLQRVVDREGRIPLPEVRSRVRGWRRRQPWCV